jgi:hypothetical protein
MLRGHADVLCGPQAALDVIGDNWPLLLPMNLASRLDMRDLGQILAHVHDQEIETAKAEPPKRPPQ